MFNGLIKDFGKIVANDGKKLQIASNIKVDLGDSVAVNGACLSVVKYDNSSFCVELSTESASVLALENFSVNSLVHLEPAMRLGDGIHGHLVQGHIDGLGVLENIKKKSSGVDYFVRLPKFILPFIAHKGSVAVEGVSLTISEIKGDIMRLSIIPLTLKDTLFKSFALGRRLHIESDLLARYAARILEFSNNSKQNSNENLTWEECEFYAKLF